MADNPYVNKVVLDGNTLIDLSEDTVEASALAEGYTAHDRTGAPIVGTSQALPTLTYSPLTIAKAKSGTIQGGYAVLGNLVIINVYFEASVAISRNNSLFTDAPSPLVSAVAFNCIPNREVALTTGGTAFMIDSSNIPVNSSVYCTGVYLKA